MRKFIVTVILSIAFCCVASAQSFLQYNCSYYGDGNGSSWARDGKYEHFTERRFPYEVYLISAEKASKVNENGQKDVVVVNRSGKLDIVETTETGNTILTTIFIVNKTENGKIPVVTSRHVWAVAGVMVSQYYGECTAEKIGSDEGSK